MTMNRWRSVKIPDSVSVATLKALLDEHDVPDDATLAYDTERTYYDGINVTLSFDWSSPETPAERKNRLAAVRRHKAEVARREAANQAALDAQTEAAYQALMARRAKEAQDA